MSREDHSIDVESPFRPYLALRVEAEGGVILLLKVNEVVGGSVVVGVVGEGASREKRKVLLVLPPSAKYRNSLTDEKLHFLLGVIIVRRS